MPRKTRFGGCFFFAFVSLKGRKKNVYEKLKVYIAGKIFLFKNLEFHKQPPLILCNTQRRTTGCVYFHHFRMFNMAHIQEASPEGKLNTLLHQKKEV